jgi:hypothetical protein
MGVLATAFPPSRVRSACSDGVLTVEGSFGDEDPPTRQFDTCDLKILDSPVENVHEKARCLGARHGCKFRRGCQADAVRAEASPRTVLRRRAAFGA